MIEEIVRGVIPKALEFIADEGGNLAKEALKAAQLTLESCKVRETPETYINNFRLYHGQIKIFGMQDPVSIEGIYAGTNFSSALSSTLNYKLPDELESERMDSGSRVLLPKKAKELGVSLANQEQYLVVLGGPGSGKSTFIRRVALESLKSESNLFSHECIPVFIELKRFKDEKIDFEGVISEEFEKLGLLTSTRQLGKNDFLLKGITKTLLSKGQLLILLDGLDELPTSKIEPVINEIENFVKSANKSGAENRFIVSCRGAAYHKRLKVFKDVEISSFRDDQIERAINYWFQARGKRSLASSFWRKVSHEDYIDTKELTQTPLLLTFMCLLFERTGQFPARRATLYKRALNILLEEWAAEKEIPYDNVYKGLDTELKVLLLSEIAYNSFNESSLYIYANRICSIIESFLFEDLRENFKAKGSDILEAIEIQHGILIQQAYDIYSFSHLTLQEYLTARYIIDNDRIDKLIDDFISDVRWREVFLQIAGLKPASVLIEKLLKKTQTFIVGDYLEKNLICLSKSTSTPIRGFNSVDRRASAALVILSMSLYAVGNNLLLSEELRQNIFLFKESLIFYGDSVNNSLNELTTKYIRAFLALNYVKDVSRGCSRTRAKYRTIDKWKKICKCLIYACKQLSDCLSSNLVFGIVASSSLIKDFARIERRIPRENKADLETYEFIAEEIFSTFLRSIEIPRQNLILKKDDLLSVKQYFLACDLIIRCSKEAIQLSRETRMQIETEVFFLAWR
ncbi:MAG: NACHT domain-containing protein [Bacteroidota bacterium]